ncbi:MAG TPA: DUF6325 family protein [Dermatophilaceae bacterium]|nr:DUF6325 family protein [Dermatophilaceae bacterium]
MTATPSPAPDLADHLGSVSYLAVELPADGRSGEGFEHLLALVDAGRIVVLDLEFVRRAPGGSLTTVDAAALDVPGLDVSAFSGADSHLLDRDDLELVGAELAEGKVLAVLIYEHLSMEPVLAAWGAAGARLLAEGPVEADDVEAALDSTTERTT